MLYELRTYKAAPGRLGTLHARFRDHTRGLFQRHGIDDVVYWTYLAGGHNDELVYLVRFDDAASRTAAWKSFIADPDWQQAYKESHERAGGPINQWVDNRFLSPTDFHPTDHGGPSDSPRIFEWRSYIAAPGKMPLLLDRFRKHTTRMFAQHGLTSIGYWLNDVGGSSDELIYVLAFDDLAQRDSAWAAFGADEEWRAVRAATNKDGNIVSRVVNALLIPTDYSPLQ